jgi:hypothetical protein
MLDFYAGLQGAPGRLTVERPREENGMKSPLDPDWPALEYEQWAGTALTLKLWTQVVGKIRLSRTPWVNHGWQVALYVHARGLGTSPIPVGAGLLEMDFDFLSQQLVCRTSGGETGAFPLQAEPVAAFYARVVKLLGAFDIEVAINTKPSEVEGPIPFPEDFVHATYDPDAAQRFWRVLVQADRLLKQFRTSFVGKVSPVHFFWGGLDLAVTRFSGRRAPPHPGTPGLPLKVARDAYSHEVSSAGFWPGNDAFPEAAFYSYAYPAPPGFADAAMPEGARFEPVLGEFILPYAAVRAARDPDALVREFLQATYAAAADCAGWDRDALDCEAGLPGVPIGAGPGPRAA